MRLLATRISSFVVGKSVFSRNLHVPVIVEQDWLAKHQKEIKILDATHAMQMKPDHNVFMAKNYGQFEKLMRERTNKEFLDAHIPGAVHFDLDVANYPGKFSYFDLYPPKIFEKYMQLLGVHNSDHIVIYGRGKAAGMVFAARAWWMLKVYGHKAVSVLNGGFDAWTKAGNPIDSGCKKPEKGSWIAREPFDVSRMITFNELVSQENGTPLIDKLQTVNFLDTRIEEQFNGKIPLGYPAKNATGYHIKGSKSVPIASVIEGDKMKNKEDILMVLRSVNYDSSKPTYLSCNRGIQASLVALALEHADIEGKVYNGSFEEICQRASRYINCT